MPTPGALLPRDRFTRWRTPARRAGAALAAVTLTWVVAHTAADRGSLRARVRDKAKAVLAARLPDAVLGDEVSIDWLFRASVGPVTIPARTPGAPPVVGIEKVKVRLAWLALASGRVVPASVRLYGVRVAPGPGGKELLELVDRVQRALPAAAPGPVEARREPDPVLHVRGLTVALVLGARTLDLGPLDARLERTRGEGVETVELDLGLPGGGHARAELRRQRPAGADVAAAPPAARPAGPASPSPSPTPSPAPRGTPARAAAVGPAAHRPSGPPPWSLSGHLAATTADLPATLRGRALAATDGALTLELAAEGTAAGGAKATLRGRLAGLVLRGQRLGPEPVGPLDLSGEASLEASQADRRVRLSQAVLRPAGPLSIEVEGELTAAADLPFQLAVTVPPVDYGALLAALPAALAPGPDAPRPAGAVGGTLELSGSLRAPEAWAVKAEVDLDGLRAAARRGPPSPLRAPFTAHGASAGRDDGPAILLGPANPAFVPVAELPEHVVRAITTSEDAGFFAHHGFDFDELRNALVAGARAGKLQRGGSTITQQLAKNLFLSRDRTLARKVREALITVALEGTVPKARLLEIYLNLIEWGPGLHGLGPAARHYLGKDARSLTPREACFLATLIPSPVRSHAALAAGVPVERWSERIDDLLHKLAVTGVLDEGGLERELVAPLALEAWVPRGVGVAENAGGPPAGREDLEPEEEATSTVSRQEPAP
jgi:transglycosylase-like protein